MGLPLFSPDWFALAATWIPLAQASASCASCIISTMAFCVRRSSFVSFCDNAPRAASCRLSSERLSNAAHKRFGIDPGWNLQDRSSCGATETKALVVLRRPARAIHTPACVRRAIDVGRMVAIVEDNAQGQLHPHWAQLQQTRPLRF